MKTESTPRLQIRDYIARNDFSELMIRAAQMHGHYCPGLAMGIKAAVYAMNELEAESDGMEDLLAITETNNCFSDGVQFVTGCTFGNNALIFKDLGKTAFTLTVRSGNGIRVFSKPESQQVIRDAFPDYRELYQKVVAGQNHDPQLVSEYKKKSQERAFGTLTLPFESLFDTEQVQVDVPIYARIYDSVICSVCGENVMITRTVPIEDQQYTCFHCAGYDYRILTGNGITNIKQTDNL
jgi:formylmethanofuran dehydrogenase subunit E